MTKALRRIAPFVFEILNLHRLEAACLLNNSPSQKVLEKIGFQKEGIARRYLQINGIWHDHILYALLHDDIRP